MLQLRPSSAPSQKKQNKNWGRPTYSKQYKYNAIRWRQIFHSNQGKKQNNNNNNNNKTQQQWRSIFRVFKKLLSTVLLEDHFSKLRIKHICSNKT